MRSLRVLTVIVTLLMALGEVARWWGQARLVPLAFDELLVAVAMLGAAAIAPRAGTAPLAAAWGLFCGVTLGLLVPTLDHLLHGPPKASAGFYAIVLATMLAVGVWAVVRALHLGRQSLPPRD
ncbi:hypothetical protein [Sphingosinicella sp. LY1275]|uniref:hypothetical protein n=1 Tax=Sphingosinicella sp. LY1275 TaxID=3095379 RepID=UPI002ADECF17|nr:hypothetical protein [Sphingosinicella sp. LY1275]MEA1013619.1 hypothetical protein [Sphingosinicella sp. LY1275]